MGLEDRGRGPQTEATSQPLEARKDRGVSESETESHSVMSDSLRPHGLYSPWNSSGQKWVAFPFSRGPSQPRDRNQVSCIAGILFTSWATREAQDLPWDLWKEGRPAHTLISLQFGNWLLTSEVQSCKKIYLYCFKPLHLW